MQIHAVRSIEIAASLDEVFAFVADRNHLPRWTNAFASVDANRARMHTPAGSVEVELDVRASREHGTIDWIMRFPDGSVAAAYSRVTPADETRVVYSFVLNAPPVPLEQLEGALHEQAATLESEMARLRELLENDGRTL